MRFPNKQDRQMAVFVVSHGTLRVGHGICAVRTEHKEAYAAGWVIATRKAYKDARAAPL